MTFIQDNYILKIVQGLNQEYEKRNNKTIDKNTILNFLKGVTFVVDKNSKSNYVKKIIDLKKSFGKNNKFFEDIFDEIRDMQSVLKNQSIHLQEIENAVEVLHYNKYLEKNKIEMLIVNRIVGADIFKNIGALN